MNPLEPSTLTAALELLQTAIVPSSTKDGTEYLVIPADAQVYDLEKLLKSPRRIRQSVRFSVLDSFCSYVKEFKTDGTKIFLNARTGTIAATLDYHKPDQASWGDHRAGFDPVLSEEWQRWQQLNNQPCDQKRFALFLEDNAVDIVDPAAAEMLDISRSLTAKINVNFKKGIRLENGTEQIQYEETIDARAGQRGQLEVPSKFSLFLMLWEGRPRRRIDARLRYGIKEGVLSFCYSLIRPQDIVQAEIDLLVNEVFEQTEIEPLFGS